ncbi:hypothetical protein KC330_g5230 [Hortaea werneckii]|nr:hypothetical protein KC330_g5230 [Hortaea werneckii]
MANLTQLSVTIFVLIFTSSARGAMFCKDPTADCKCSGLVPSLNKCTTIDPANSTCYPDRYAPNFDIIAKAIHNACGQFQNPRPAELPPSPAGKSVPNTFVPGSALREVAPAPIGAGLLTSTLVLGNTGSGPYCPAGKFMMFGHEKESSAKHDGEDYEDELQELANQHAGEVMIVARQDEVDARLDNEYEDKLQALANEQAGTLMIVARDDNM